MNVRILHAIVLATMIATSLVSTDAIAGPGCACTHQGASVDCPSGLPPGSRSAQFVSGGTNWVTPTGQTVFVPQTSFSCSTPTSTTPLPSGPKTTPSRSTTAPQNERDTNRSHGLLDKAATGDLLMHLGHSGKQHRHDEHPIVAAPLKEDPAISCYRHVNATTTDGGGAVHTGTLFDQLRQATGIDRAQVCGGSGSTCEDPAYDCGGDFYDADGKPAKLPPFPQDARNDADVAKWKADVADFYRNSYLDPAHTQRLSPGKSMLCREWAGVHFQTGPDPSILQALDALQQIGGEKATHLDMPWIDHIVDTGSANGCPTPPLPPAHDADSVVVPEESARSFLRDFRDCTVPDTNHVGGCPHAFDPAGNQVNARYLLSAAGSTSFFIDDDTGGCGMSCYRPVRDALPTADHRPVLASSPTHADPDCSARISTCVDSCRSANSEVAKRCIEAGGVPDPPGMCTVNEGACNCTQTAPGCRVK
jgi:hypothetical protein